METTETKPNFTHKDIRDIFYLSNNTIKNYIRQGLLPFPELEDGEHVFDRKAVLESLGLKDLPAEPFIIVPQVVDILKLKKGVLGINKVGYLCRKGVLPHYRFNNVTASCYLFLESEVRACMQYKMKRIASAYELSASRTKFVQKLIKALLDKSTEIDANKLGVVTDVLVHGKTLEKIGKQKNLTKERIRQILASGIKELEKSVHLYQPNVLHEMRDRIAELENEIKFLKQQNQLEEVKTENEQSEADYIKQQSSLPPIHANITDTDVSIRSLNVLKRLEVTTPAQLSLIKRSYIVKMRNAGNKTLAELDELLEKNGLKWVPENYSDIVKNDMRKLSKAPEAKTED